MAEKSEDKPEKIPIEDEKEDKGNQEEKKADTEKKRQQETLDMLAEECEQRHLKMIEEIEKKHRNCQFGVRCYMHQFYVPGPVHNPGIYEFPSVNSTGSDDLNHKHREVSILFVVMFFLGVTIAVVFGVLESIETFDPEKFAEFNERFPGIQGWTTVGFLAGIMLIIISVLLQLLYNKVLAIERYQAELQSRDDYNTPKYHERIPLREEIQAVQPPPGTIMSSMH